MARLLCLLLALTIVAPLAAQDADLDLMMRYVAGRFDNNLQVWQENEDGLADSLRQEHVHSIFAPVDLPAISENVFYVQQYRDGDTDRVFRQRLYTFASGEGAEAGSVVLSMYTFPDDDAVLDAHLYPERLDGLSLEMLGAYPGCEVYWTREGDAFRGSTRPGACRVAARPGLTLALDLYQDEDETWFREKASTGGGAYVFSHPGGEFQRLRRADPFSGWAVLRADGSRSIEPAPDSAFVMVRGLTLHDEGDRRRLVLEDGTDTGITVELAQLVYQASQAAILKLALYREGEDRAFAYTWADPGASRIGVNMRWIQVGLTRESGAR